MIIFEKVRWRNFLSTGNQFTEISLTRSNNTLIIGHNGAGKSTILDALCFGLFGKPFRKINKPQLLNSINNQQAVVEVEFTIGQKKYKIVRGIKPNIFEVYCQGVLVDQNAASRDYQEVLEKSILRLNYKSFTQVVILGSASFVPFMQLTPADRRLIIEDLLDIRIFSTMNGLVKDKLAIVKDANQKLKYDLDLVAEKIKMQKSHIEALKTHNDSQVTLKEAEIDSSNEQIVQLQKDIDLIQKHIDVMNSKISDSVSVNKKQSKLLHLESKLESKKRKISKDIEFYQINSDCSTCRQAIEESFRQDQIKTGNQTREEVSNALIDIANEVVKINSRITEIQSVVKHITAHNNEIVKHNSTIAAINKFISKLNKEILELSNRTDNLEDENAKLKELKEELETFLKKQESLSIEKQYYEYASTLLKDTGIKTKIIRQYLPIMNKLVNKYLTAMDFFVNFNINENFEETIKSRHRDVFSYANFSEGEKMRIDLALLFTWRQIAKLKNSTNTNLLILDEVFDSSLDTVGTEEFLKLIHEIGADTNVFVISHKGDQLFDKFRSIIKFKKVNNFSQVEK
jgi:DNA repair exonuclease SbcCD ATPase subunit